MGLCPYISSMPVSDDCYFLKLDSMNVRLTIEHCINKYQECEIYRKLEEDKQQGAKGVREKDKRKQASGLSRKKTKRYSRTGAEGEEKKERRTVYSLLTRNEYDSLCLHALKLGLTITVNKGRISADHANKILKSAWKDNN